MGQDARGQAGLGRYPRPQYEQRAHSEDKVDEFASKLAEITLLMRRNANRRALPETVGAAACEPKESGGFWSRGRQDGKNRAL